MSDAAQRLNVPRSHWEIVATSTEGKELWREEADNIVFDPAIDAILETYFRGAAYTAAWFVGLVGTIAGGYSSGDTLASHAGWLEIVDYAGSVRQPLNLSPVVNKATSNISSKAVFTLTAMVNLNGAFVCAGDQFIDISSTLYCAVNFLGGSRALNAGDSIAVTVTLSGA